VDLSNLVSGETQVNSRRQNFTAEKYRAFWANKVTPMSSDSPTFRRLLAQELRLLLGNRKPVRVLEIGCGNGWLFDSLDFSPSSYRGVDFGPLMLAAFRSSHPDLDLVEAEGSSYRDDRSYDLIFSIGVIQHFSADMLDQHFRNARSMMQAESLLILAGVPWRVLRPMYDRGLFSNGVRASSVRRAKNQILRILGRDFMGHWYRPEEISALARKHKLEVRFHGSIAQPFRFHAVLWPESATPGVS
jgi:cyclopropane fatty-acyl-phospholipid synthase-like methyltransferase